MLDVLNSLKTTVQQISRRQSAMVFRTPHQTPHTNTADRGRHTVRTTSSGTILEQDRALTIDGATAQCARSHRKIDCNVSRIIMCGGGAAQKQQTTSNKKSKPVNKKTQQIMIKSALELNTQIRQCQFGFSRGGLAVGERRFVVYDQCDLKSAVGGSLRRLGFLGPFLK